MMVRNNFLIRSLFLSWVLGLGIYVSAETQTYFPVSKPDVGNGRLVVCGQNTRNYFVVNLAADRSSCHDIESLESKTAKMVNAFRYLDADIYCLNELEVNDSVLSYLTNAMNQDAGTELYAYIKDGLLADTTMVKSGYMYRKDKVKPYGGNIATSSQYYYENTMRMQAFEELSTGERFVLSVNHFKAKDNTSDAGNSKRECNATDLVSALSSVNLDPDILVVGDLNCTITENPLVYILNAGYTEQLLAYDSGSWSHIFSGEQQLIDHVFANASMGTQITGAGVFHVNTSIGGTYWYSDHDPYMVALNLASEAPIPTPCEDINDQQVFHNSLGTYSSVGVQGNTTFYSNDNYGAKATGYTKQGVQECWLISPAYDLQQMQDASIEFRHNIFKNNQGGTLYTQQQTLWVSNDYMDGNVPSTATWTQVTIPSYSVASWVNCTIPVPAANLQDNFRFAFKYEAPDGGNGNYWEIDHATLIATCNSLSSGVEQVSEEPLAIDIHDVSTRIYSVMGYDMSASRDNLPGGVYILFNGSQAKKVVLP